MPNMVSVNLPLVLTLTTTDSPVSIQIPELDCPPALPLRPHPAEVDLRCGQSARRSHGSKWCPISWLAAGFTTSPSCTVLDIRPMVRAAEVDPLANVVQFL